jgi:hypothetical protein
MIRIFSVMALLALAACAPRVHHREAQRPAGADAYACAAREVERMGYRLSIVEPGESFTATRPRAQPADARYPVYDYLAVEVLHGVPRMLRVGAVTLAGGGGGVAPHFRAPLPRTEEDRDAVLDVCAPSS